MTNVTICTSKRYYQPEQTKKSEMDGPQNRHGPLINYTQNFGPNSLTAKRSVIDKGLGKG